MIMVDNKYNFGETVYLKTDPEQLPRMVLYYLISPNSITYGLQSGANFSYHYEMEISKEKTHIEINE